MLQSDVFNQALVSSFSFILLSFVIFYLPLFLSLHTDTIGVCVCVRARERLGGVKDGMHNLDF